MNIPIIPGLDEIETSLLVRKKILTIGGDINDSVAHHFGGSIAWLISQDSPDITIYFNSRGGDAQLGIALHDLLRSYEGYVEGIVLQNCQSAALTIMQACNHRVARPTSRILFHHTSRLMSVGWFNKDLSLTKEGLRRLNDTKLLDRRSFAIFKSRSHLSKRKLLRLRKKDKVICGPKALKFGLVDEVRDPCETPFQKKQ